MTREDAETMIELIDNELEFLNSSKSDYTEEEEKAKVADLNRIRAKLEYSIVPIEQRSGKKFRVVTKAVHQEELRVWADDKDSVEMAIEEGDYEALESTFEDTVEIVSVTEEVK